MAITQTAREQLGAQIIGHDDLGTTVRLQNGMIKSKKGLIAPPSGETGDTRSGTLSESEEVVQEAVIVPQHTIATPKAKKSRKRVAQQETAQTVEEYIRMSVTVEGFGSIPTQYVHCYVGDGIAVLGLMEFSFKPEVAENTEAGGLTHVIQLDKIPGRSYIYCGNKYVDKDGVVNIILVEIK